MANDEIRIRRSGRIRPRRAPVCLVAESLEHRLQLAAVNFVVQPTIEAPDHAGTRHVVMADLDQDLDLDLLVSSSLDHRVSWYENLDGEGMFGDLRLITESAKTVEMSIAVDLDGDNDLDVATVSPGNNRVSWYENLNGLGSFGTERVVTETAIRGSSVSAADLDQDGDMDLISASSEEYDSDISWYENLDGLGTFGPQQIVTANLEVPLSTHAADLDGDGDYDLLATSLNDGRVVWFENLDSSGTFSDFIEIDELDLATEAVTADLDGDSDLDIIAGTNEYPSSIVWYENTNQGEFSEPQMITEEVDGVTTLQAIDWDGDMDLDLVSSSLYDDKAAWYENLDGQGTFGAQNLIPVEAINLTSIDAQDIDGDGDIDVAYSSYQNDVAAWLRNDNGEFVSTRVSRPGVAGVESIVAVDLDGDLDLDLAIASVIEGTVAWYENLDGLGTYGSARPIDDDLAGAISIRTADLNGDLSPDLLVASATRDMAVWYANDGFGNFASRAVIAIDLFASESAAAADIDGDGDLDVVGLATGLDDLPAGIFWFENVDGQGNFGRFQEIENQLERPREVAPVDMDDDGDVDLAVVSWLDNTVAWLENDGNTGFVEHSISFDVSVPISVRAGDIDLDGDPDLLVAGFLDNRVYWFENTDSNRFETHVLPAPLGPEGIALADLDLDGDLDIVSAAVVDDAVSWYENLDGKGTFSDLRVIDDTVPGASEVIAADIDGDGDADLVAGAYNASRVAWYRNDTMELADFNNDGMITAWDVDQLCAAIASRDNPVEFDLTGEGLVNFADYDRLVHDLLGTTAGDANLDGIFDTEDLVFVFIRGEYNDGIQSNSGWADGDWNCDGEFDSQDIVVAFQAGSFVSASKVSLHDLAAARTDD